MAGALGTVVVAHAGEIGESFAQRIAGVVHPVVEPTGVSFDIPKRVAELLSGKPEVLVLGEQLTEAQLMGVTEFIDLHHPETAVVWVREATPATWQLAVRSGARDVIDPGADARVITEALDRARLRLLSRQQFGTPAPAAITGGTVIVVASPKGGCGKTMISTNIATVLASEHPNDVLLIDLDVQFGDVASHLRLSPTYGIHTAALAKVGAAGHQSADIGASGELKAFLTHFQGELLTLCAPLDPTAAEDVTAESVTNLLRVAAAAFRFVIVDTGAGLDDLTLAAIDAAHELILVSSTDVPAVRAIKTELALLDRMGSTAKRHLVLNRSDAKVGLAVSDIELALEMKITARIPSSIDVPESINIGSPVVVNRPRNGASKELQSLAKLVSGGHSWATGQVRFEGQNNKALGDATSRIRSWIPGKAKP
jgi:pilus assembly protein CpaE